MKLIELSKNHYVIVDDSDVKEGDFVFDFEERLFYRVKKAMFGTFLLSCRKITHSTQPLDRDIHGFGYWSKNIIPLSLSEVEEAIFGYSVEKMAQSVAFTHPDFGKYKVGSIAYYNGYISGFKAHQELVKNMMHGILSDFYVFATNGEVCNHEVIDEFLLPKTEWEVEFDEQGKLRVI